MRPKRLTVPHKRTILANYILTLADAPSCVYSSGCVSRRLKPVLALDATLSSSNHTMCNFTPSSAAKEEALEPVGVLCVFFSFADVEDEGI